MKLKRIRHYVTVISIIIDLLSLGLILYSSSRFAKGEDKELDDEGDFEETNDSL